jgi:hypothetical protein
MQTHLYHPRPFITRIQTHAVVCLASLAADRKSCGGGSYKRSAVPPAYARSCQDVTLRCTSAAEQEDYNVRNNVLHRWRSLNVQYPLRVKPLVYLSSLWTITYKQYWEHGGYISVYFKFFH